MRYSEEDLERVHKTSIANKSFIQGAKDCGCFSCLAHFPPDQADFCEDAPQPTAVGPHCAVDSVIAEHSNDRVDDELLRALRRRWFGIGDDGRALQE